MTMSKPVISVIMTSIRNFRWREICRNLSSSKIDFEIIAVGPNPPLKKLPNYFIFVQSEVKPAQCIEIAARKARGKYLLYIADDLILSRKFLDVMYSFFEKNCTENDIASGLLTRYGQLVPNEMYRFWSADENSPIFPLGMFIRKDRWSELGGMDKRIIAVQGDIDLVLRNYEAGGRYYFVRKLFVMSLWTFLLYGRFKTFLLKNKLVCKHRRYFRILRKIILPSWSRSVSNNQGTLHAERGKGDRDQVDKWWVTGNDPTVPDEEVHARLNKKMLLKKRREPISPFCNRNILSVSQGPKGRW